MIESHYQADLIKKLRVLLPDCVILKNDTSYMQGVPDLLILFQDKWAMLEVKVSAGAAVQPNQQFYVEQFNEMSFAAFIYPENEKRVLDALQRSLTARRTTRVSKRV
jgi:hypothetical protein